MRQKPFTVCWSFPVCRRNRQKKNHFERSAEPLEADVIIIDEMSMVDIFLMPLAFGDYAGNKTDFGRRYQSASKRGRRERVERYYFVRSVCRGRIDKNFPSGFPE